LRRPKHITDFRTLKSIFTELLDVGYSHFRKNIMVLLGMVQQVLDEQELIELGQQCAESQNIIVDGHGCLEAA
jgi:hypothetical protein